MNQQVTPQKRSRRDTNKERVIRQALSCFVEKGIEATKISDIAKLANITDRSIYRYFATKADLVLETALLFWSEAMAQVDAQAHMELDGDICGADCIPRILQGYANLYFTHRQMLIFVHEAEAYLNRSGKALLVENKPPAPFEQSAGPLSSAIHKGIADGSVRTDIDLPSLYYNTYDALLGLIQKLAIGGRNNTADDEYARIRLEQFCTMMEGFYRKR